MANHMNSVENSRPPSDSRPTRTRAGDRDRQCSSKSQNELREHSPVGGLRSPHDPRPPPATEVAPFTSPQPAAPCRAARPQRQPPPISSRIFSLRTRTPPRLAHTAPLVVKCLMRRNSRHQHKLAVASAGRRFTFVALAQRFKGTSFAWRTIIIAWISHNEI